ncbi:hypothetical protein E1B28_008713 [Marasmius oreades]|uniref:Uncharacterized protein n=1 Tax=Marasmius oreades TaxID=181124 RepID=A0A9P7S0J5_9AGAR|nr:uncharacterized protein E1B28_008713 [Marasmius oreades]KAG7092353.1 hypothetical protein E1B28_008713 [Marasmius oreades]
MSTAVDEQQPLLDPEAQSTSSIPNPSFRERLAALVESNPFHKTVIALIIIDTACVLADLGYTFINSWMQTSWSRRAGLARSSLNCVSQHLGFLPVRSSANTLRLWSETL